MKSKNKMSSDLKKTYYIWIIQMFKKCKQFWKTPIGSWCNSRHKYTFSAMNAQKFHHLVVSQSQWLFHSLPNGFFRKQNCVKSLHNLNQIILFRKSLKHIYLYVKGHVEDLILILHNQTHAGTYTYETSMLGAQY